MYSLTCGFPRQCASALTAALEVPVSSLSPQPEVVVLTGLGGSAAGGDFAKGLFEVESRTPFLVNRDYTLPHFVGPETLVIASSYSGNTEETLSAFEDAQAKGARPAIVTSGGALAELAAEDPSIPFFRIPGGQPPRTALGFMLIPVLSACERWGLLPELDYAGAFATLEGCVEDWVVDVPFAENPTKRLAASLHRKLPILYGLGAWQGAVAYRWKGQIGENAKNLCFHHAFPELNHNEILGWVRANEQGVEKYAVVILEDGSESPKMKARAKVTSSLIQERAEVFRVQARGESLLERILSLTLFGDFVSLYLAALNDVDPENIDSINVLKSELAKVPAQ